MHETDEERYARIARDGSQAEIILNHPLIQQFFENQRAKAWNVYQGLPMPATQDQYVSVQATLYALDALEKELTGYVEQWGHQKNIDAQEETEGDSSLY